VHRDRLLRLLRRPQVVIGLFALVGLIASAAYMLAPAPRYRSTATVFVSVESVARLPDLGSSDRFAQQVIGSYASVATTPYVLDAVIADLGLRTTTAALARAVTADVEPDSAVIRLTATDASPTGAASIANAVADRLQKAGSALAPHDAGAFPSVHLTVVQTARVPTAPMAPDALVDLTLGLLAGLGVGMLAARLVEQRA
jgi:polysaccharide biosynthesis transport protein